MKGVVAACLVLCLTLCGHAGAPAQGHLYSKAAPSGPAWETTSAGYTDIPDLDIWFYQRDEGNACIGISAEVFSTDGKRVFVRALVDEEAAAPSDVVFTSEFRLHGGTFLFSKNIAAGIHRVRFQTKVDGGGTAYFGDRTMWVVTSPMLVNVVAAPSGPVITTASASMTDIPDMSLNITMPVDGRLVLTFSAEILCDNGNRTFLRMLVDDVPADPSNVVMATSSVAGVHAATFVSPLLSQGPHTVTAQWSVDGGGTAYVGDRTLSVGLSDPVAAQGGNAVHSVSPPSGPDVVTTATGWEDIPGLAIDVTVPDNASLLVMVNGETECTGGRVGLMAAVDGEHCFPSDAILLDKSGWPGTTSLAFIRKGVPGGQHTVKAMWGVDGGQTGYMGDRNMTVLVFASDVPDMTGDFQALTPAIRSNPVLVLLWDPHRASHPAPSVGAMSNLVHGSYPSVVDYFASLSGGRFTLANAGILGWYDAVMPADFYWAPNDPADADGDGFVSGHVRKWWEAISMADPVFNFASYDADGDGVLTPRELAIAIVIPQNGAFGTNRVPASREYPSWEPLVVDGVRIPVISEMYAGSPPNLGLFVHELCHLVLNLPDMYFGFFYPFAAGQYSIMDVTYIDSHLDPFAKMRLGWLQPTIVASSGSYSISACEAGGETYVLLDPKHGNREYYLVENRQRSFSYDTQLSDSGLAVWHVIEDPSVFGALSAPAGVSSTDWNTIPAGDWGRRAVRMIRPVYGPPFDNGRALWDGADPATGYDLVSTDPAPGHAQLRWADGSESGFAVRDISPAAGLMTAYFEIPGTPSDARETAGLPSAFALDQNYPNPFNPSTTIRYRLPVASDVRLAVYDILGREVTRLLEGRQSAGSRTAVWDGSGSSSGLYFCRLDATGGNGVRFSAVVKMVLVK